MPSIPDEYVPLQPMSPRVAQPQPEVPGIVETLGATNTLFNGVFRSYRYMINRGDNPVDLNHDPFAMIKGTKYEAGPERFAYSHNERETRAIMSEWDADENARDVYSRSGWTGVVAAAGIGLLTDPTIFLPIAKVFTGTKAGLTALRLAGDTALSGAMGASVNEFMMAKTTPEYTSTDAAINIGSATLLSGLLGGGAGALLSRAERNALTDALHADRVAMTNDLQPVTNDMQPGGAAVSDTRDVRLVKTPIDKALDAVRRVVPPSIADYIPKTDIFAKFSPLRRVLNSEFVSARRALVDMAETSHLIEGNVDGIATTQGPALDRLVKLYVRQSRVALSDKLESAFTRYRGGHVDLGGIRQQAQRASFAVADLRGRTDGYLTYGQFKDAIDEALRNGDQHAIPEVAEVAQWARSNIVVPWRDRAIKAGLLPEDVDVETATSYMMRSWNIQKIIARRPEVVERFAKWLASEDSKKIAIRDRVSGDYDSLRVYSSTIDDLEGKLAKRMAMLDDLDARSEEMTRLNQAAFQRARSMRENPAFGLEVLRTDAQKNNAKGGAVFETKIRDRGNDLADRASAREAEIADLQNRIGAMTVKRDKLRADIEDSIRQWEGNSAKEAKAALKAREAAEKARDEAQAAGTYKGKGERLTSADAAIEKTVKRILAREARSQQEHEARANEIVDRIIGSPDGRLPYDTETSFAGGAPAEGARGPLASRDFMIPDNQIRDLLNTDSEDVLAQFLNSIVPDVLLTERFGDVEMTDVFRKINEESARRVAAAKTEKERTAIDDERKAVHADIAAIRDRIRGTYGNVADPRMRYWGRMAANAGRYNQLTDMGGVVLSSIPDIAGAIFHYGFAGPLKHQIAPLMRLLGSKEMKELGRASKQELRAFGIGVETVLQARNAAMSDIFDMYKPTSRLERGLEKASNAFFILNGLAPWTDAMQRIAGTTAMDQFNRAIEATVKGTAKAAQTRKLAEAGIDSTMAGRIWQQLNVEGGSNIIDGVRLSNTGAWVDQGARDAFEGAIARDVDMMVISPGQEKSLWPSRNPAVALLLQYKTFVMASTERIFFRGMQARDAQVLQGIVAFVGLGMIGEYAYDLASGRDQPKTLGDWVKAGASRSGMFGWLEEGNAVASKWTGGTMDMYRSIGATQPGSRYQSREKLGILLGPTANKLEGLIKAGANGVNGEWGAADYKRIRRMVAGQNLFYLRKLFDGIIDE